MPSKNIIKPYRENSYYHLYNRGVEKRKIFIDSQDRSVFLSYLKSYLLPKNIIDLQKKLGDINTSYREKDKLLKLLRLNNFNGMVDMLAYCLMPNHFHFLLFQKEADIIDKLMQSMCTRYSMYFNRKYKRVGPLFQGSYKGVLVETDGQLIHLSRYIHYQATYSQGVTLQTPYPSSYPNYLGKTTQDWIKSEIILAFFSKSIPNLTYKAFLEEYKDSKQDGIEKLVLE